MDELLIPWGRDVSGEIHRAINAKKEWDYFCPQCGDILTLKIGPKKRAHFAHRNNKCNPESLSHILAKELVALSINRGKYYGVTQPVDSR